MLARLIVPPQVRRGDHCEVALSILHPMETGYRRKDDGSLATRNLVEAVVITFDETLVMELVQSAGVAANPYFAFSLLPPRTGTLTARWKDTSGAVGHISAKINVVG